MTDTTDQALYVRVKVLHPYWSDELVKKEIERLRSSVSAEWYEELLQKVRKQKQKQ